MNRDELVALSEILDSAAIAICSEISGRALPQAPATGTGPLALRGGQRLQRVSDQQVNGAWRISIFQSWQTYSINQHPCPIPPLGLEPIPDLDCANFDYSHGSGLPDQRSRIPRGAAP